ncbi:hypothetical protein E2C01_022154 [Portunus trituberculatus]|uniref:Uncharacterized protein n=1 Tax=Portunus trituberculatus TaxID=210409 RepID=A0A5B7E591_PORTR|nr:hypothetical protein [Portunus trituberculatus]
MSWRDCGSGGVCVTARPPWPWRHCPCILTHPHSRRYRSHIQSSNIARRFIKPHSRTIMEELT